MRRWLFATVVTLTLAAVGCEWGSDSPALLDPPDGLKVEEFESQEMQLPEQGSARFVFTQTAIAISAVSVDAKATGGTASIEIAVLSGQPADLPSPPALDTYQLIEIGTENLDDPDIESVTLAFVVSQQWLDANGHDADAIALQRFSDGWDVLPTRLLGREGDEVLYEAVSPGLSLFAVTAVQPEELVAVVLPSPTPSPVMVPSATPTPFPTLTPSPSATPRPTSTPSPRPIPTATPTSTPVPTVAPKASPTATAPAPSTPSPRATATASPTHTPSATPTPTRTSTPRPSATPSPSPTATRAPSATPTPDSSPTATATPTPTPATPTSTPLPTATIAPPPTNTAVPPNPTNTPTTVPPTPTSTPTPVPPTPTSTPTPVLPTPTSTPTSEPDLLPGDERYGVALHSRTKEHNLDVLTRLGVNWYLDLAHDMSQVPDGARKVPYLKVPISEAAWAGDNPWPDFIEDLSDAEIAKLGLWTKSQLESMAQANPGSPWYIFGEPNRRDHMTGEKWAPLFHYFATVLKEADQTAKIMSPSLLNWDYNCIGCAPSFRACAGKNTTATSGYNCGKDWVQDFVTAYEDKYAKVPPVDIWAIDTYPIDWTNKPNNDPEKLARYEAQGGSFAHSYIATQQLVGMREYLETFTEYTNTPIWITELAVHVGYDGFFWALKDGGSACNGAQIDAGLCKIVTFGVYHWEFMRTYMSEVLGWLDTNASEYGVEKWFFYKTYRDIVNISSDGYMGISLLSDDQIGTPPNCLGDTYRRHSLGLDAIVCGVDGSVVIP